MNYKDFFKNKKILMMGLGILGRGVNVAKFLANAGAELTVTDLKDEEQLASSLQILSPYKNINYVLGKHNLTDFRDKDMLIKAAGVPLDSPYVAEARKNNIPVEMDASLFAKLLLSNLSTSNVDNIIVIGVTGTRGKSTVTQLIYEILTAANKRVFLGGNVKGLATLPLLEKIKTGDIVVMELDSWQLQGFSDSKISPHVAVFASFMRDHMNYYKGDMNAYFADKANIFKYQKAGDYLVCGEQVAEFMKDNGFKSIGKKLVASKKNIPSEWNIKLQGEHNLANIAMAVKASEIFGVSGDIIKNTVENFTGAPGRLEFVKEINGIKFYNDTTATTPDAAIAAVKSLREDGKSNIILIGGGADKELDFNEYAGFIKDKIKAMALFKGAATDKIMAAFGETGFPIEIFDNMPAAFKFAVSNADKGDVVLLSPGAASFGVFKNEFDRGEQFIEEISKLRLRQNE
ncbi:MAG: UDP-N-acetylmuramoyl-L-alanine--D-glutamate ligase [Candidatus Terrybacteria bacterium CG10_big_fil_rev_8_21_14_0_10_41_10]|uniref:UDP-N-acetylmuramoylalanine--D-glutamate ligase n=1 Tax=Candidatus Terrybacteria bacterium CG10_big_fil_rev_8_21_14_0_10_41_10 TaxID=1975026 RepID=A0A2M8LBG3_9BACT|nr:MAG: UDP-N-acetylmuramoyl-L-alanine--D-glutamate ligase [Candidatus Terrybacteria bacterium CG10_big_fil_rev_8_21_14_0_10_41_10]